MASSSAARTSPVEPVERGAAARRPAPEARSAVRRRSARSSSMTAVAAPIADRLDDRSDHRGGGLDIEPRAGQQVTRVGRAAAQVKASDHVQRVVSARRGRVARQRGAAARVFWVCRR